MKVGLNGRFLCHPYTGIGQYTTHLLNAMVRLAGKKVSWVVVVPETPNPSRVKIPAEVKLIVAPEKSYLPTAGLRKSHWEQKQVPHIFKKEKVDIAHYPYPANPNRHLRRMKTVVTVHDVIPWIRAEYRQRLRTRLYQRRAQKALNKADHIIAVSETTAFDLTEQIRFPYNRVTVIYEAAGTEYSLRTQKYRHGKPFFLYVGGYDPRKNVVRLVEAFQEYIAPRYAIDLLLIGARNLPEGPYGAPENLRKALAESTMKNPKQSAKGRIHLTGSLPAEKLAGYYRSCIGFVNFSLEEGFNIPLLEAAACGAPLLTSDIPIHREIVGSSALFCDPKSTRNIGETLLHFLQNPSLQKQLQGASRQLKTHYRWEKAAEETLTLYASLYHH